MLNRIFGRNKIITYDIDDGMEDVKNDDGTYKRVFVCFPRITKTSEYEKEEILSFEGRMEYNGGLGYTNYFNISEDETVMEVKRTFRADLNEMHILSDKIIKEVEMNKLENAEKFEVLQKQFNKTMIENTEELKNYCDIHCLDYENTDCVKLFKLLHQDSECIVKDEMLVLANKDFSCSDCAPSTWKHVYDSVWNDLCRCKLLGEQSTSN